MVSYYTWTTLLFSVVPVPLFTIVACVVQFDTRVLVAVAATVMVPLAVAFLTLQLITSLHAQSIISVCK